MYDRARDAGKKTGCLLHSQSVLEVPEILVVHEVPDFPVTHDAT